MQTAKESLRQSTLLGYSLNWVSVVTTKCSAVVQRCFYPFKTLTREWTTGHPQNKHIHQEKSRIQETKNLSTDMDSSTKTKKILLSKAKFSQGRREGDTIRSGRGGREGDTIRSGRGGREGDTIRSGRGGREEGKICPKTNFLRGNFTPFIRKSFQIWDHFFPLLFPKDSKSLKWTSGGRQKVVITVSQNWTDTQAARPTDGPRGSRGPKLWKHTTENYLKAT